MNLIKFHTENYLIENLANGNLFFNNFYKLNDPYEGFFRYKIPEDDEEFKRAYFETFGYPEHKFIEYNENREAFKKKINRNLVYRQKNNGVCCFSDESLKTDVLMWANYANNHKGVCLIFDQNLHFSPLPKTPEIIETSPTGPHEVTYRNKFLSNDELRHSTFLTTKPKIWEDEKEHRYTSSKSGLFIFSKSSLKEIVFGLRTCDHQKFDIKTAIENNNGYDVKFSKIKLNENHFAFEITEDNS